MSQKAEAVVRSKGDLLVGRREGIAGRLPVGADGTVLTADSTTQEGVTWGGTLFTAADKARLDAVVSSTGGAASTGTLGAAAEASITVPLDREMADDTFRVVASVFGADTGPGLTVLRVLSRTATQVVVRVVNNALVSRTGEVHVVAIAAP